MKEPNDIQTIRTMPEKTIIKFTSSWAGYDTKAPIIQTILEQFENENPNVELLNASMTGEDFLFTLTTDFASSNEPDVFGLWPGTNFNTLIKQGKVADLTQLLENNPDWYNLFNKDAWKYVTFDDRIYGLPLEIIYEGLFINRDLFEKYDVLIPTTFEELLIAIEKFKENEIIPIAYNGTPEGSFIYQNMIMQLGGKDEVENPITDEGKLVESYVKGMYYMKELYDAGAFPENAFIIDDKTRNDLFVEKKAAMIVQGSWFIGDQAVNPNSTTVDIIPFPRFEEGKALNGSIIYGCGNGIFHMSQKAWEDEEKRELCIALLEKLTSVSSAELFADSSGTVVNVIIPNQEDVLSPMQLKGSMFLKSAQEYIGPTDSFIIRSIWEEIIIEQFPSMLKGELSPEQIVEQVEIEVNEMNQVK